ncbi:hypothetical protein QEV83_10480 [Methylocapsa sp. D3K7]|uniref:hypothetical protein n=1 Tax=Methylocapsa sp. D3K7 TaxID=3041435 RepID=UPI00244E5FE9|nr:hypothetical protein [Methylocapsa sp. D3K7]WGJ13151.1 hypothetical protein QEV83_10480 [Methylocapsa sp. D3K7]
MIELGNYSLAAIFVTSIIVLLIASEVGHTIGWRAAEEANVTTLEAAILPAPMISFTFSMGLTHFDELAGDGGEADLRQCHNERKISGLHRSRKAARSRAYRHHAKTRYHPSQSHFRGKCSTPDEQSYRS